MNSILGVAGNLGGGLQANIARDIIIGVNNISFTLFIFFVVQIISNFNIYPKNFQYQLIFKGNASIAKSLC